MVRPHHQRIGVALGAIAGALIAIAFGRARRREGVRPQPYSGQAHDSAQAHRGLWRTADPHVEHGTADFTAHLSPGGRLFHPGLPPGSRLH